MGRAIALLGFTGSGKTAAGGLLAQRLGLDFVDVADEQQLAGELLPGTVLAIGSGLALEDENWHLIRTLTRSVWLDAPAEVLWARQPHPGETRAAFEQLVSLRQRSYVEADHRVDAARPLSEVVDALEALCGS